MNENFTGGHLAKDGIIVMFASVITTKLIEYFGISSTFYGILYVSVVQALETIKMHIEQKSLLDTIPELSLNIDFTNFNYFYLIIYILPLILLYRPLVNLIFSKIKELFNKIKNINKPAVKELTLYDVSKALDMAIYMNQYPEFFTGYDDVKRSDISVIQTLMSNVYKTNDATKWLNKLNQTSLPKTGKCIKVNDKKFGVNGEIVWSDYQINTVDYGGNKEDKTIHKVNFKYLTLSLEVESPALIEEYINNVSNSVNLEMHQSFTASKLIKVTDYGCEYSTKIIGSMKEYSLEKMESLYIDSFFHPKKDSLWEMLKTIKLSPEYYYKYGQTPQMNLLLYGPPGTGKSSFAYRIAKALGRNIISLDLRLIKKKSDLYNILESPTIEGRELSPYQVVYVLDEFDMTVRYLHAQQMKKNKEEERWKNQLDEMFLPYSSKLKGRSYEYSNSDSDSDSDSDSSNSEKSESSTKRKKKRRKKRKKKEKPIDYAAPDEIVLQDLLDTLQGPVPVEKRIIIATTNDYEGIRKMCGALFRPGRLTPVLFDTPDKDTMRSIIRYYFGVELDEELEELIPDKVNSPTSEIIEICLRANRQSDPIRYLKNYFIS